MNCRQMLWQFFVVFGLALVLYSDYAAAGSHQKKKKVTIHVPIHKKIEKHTHTIVKHIHHHHKPQTIVVKEEKKIIEEHHPVIKNEHVSHEHHHHHEAKHDHQHEHKHAELAKEYEDDEEHIHHHHNYEHKSHNEEIDDDFMERRH